MIKTSLNFKTMTFPCGEMHVRIDEPTITGGKIDVCFEFTKNEDILELLLFVDAAKRIGVSINELVIPYVPFGRQDRVAVRGECFSLEVFANLINSIGARVVTVYDPHSDVTPALIKNCNVFHQHVIFEPHFRDKQDYWLICPDGGALKKIYKLASLAHVVQGMIGVVECGKIRDVNTGDIVGIKVHHDNLHGKDCHIVDDICDGGRTFIEIAKALKERNAGKIILLVTHGFFTKGLDVFDGLIDEIYTTKGQVK